MRLANAWLAADSLIHGLHTMSRAVLQHLLCFSSVGLQKLQGPSIDAGTASTPAETTAPTPEVTAAPTPEPTTEATPAPTAAVTVAPTVEATPAPTAEPTVAPTVEATPAPTAEPTIAPTAEATPAQATVAPTVQATPAPPVEATAAPTAEPTTPPTTESSPSMSPNASAPYASATNNYTANASVPAPPVPPSAEVTPVPVVVPVGTQPGSDIIANITTPSPTEASPSLNASAPPVTVSSIPDGDNSLVRTSANCTLSVAALQQCGGRGGVCANQGANSSQCRDAQWDNACCTSGYYCQRKQQWSWTCQRSGIDTNVTLGGQVADYKQCGGLGGCVESLCADSIWAGYSCYTGFTCLRWDAFYWQCRDLPFAQVATTV